MCFFIWLWRAMSGINEIIGAICICALLQSKKIFYFLILHLKSLFNAYLYHYFLSYELYVPYCMLVWFSEYLHNFDDVKCFTKALNKMFGRIFLAMRKFIPIKPLYYVFNLINLYTKYSWHWVSSNILMLGKYRICPEMISDTSVNTIF